eukprot:5353565-Prorocentrum_lima.AAC.1
MTSSLVGSEMCIRDRVLNAALGPDLTKVMAAELSFNTLVLGTAFIHSPKPVSYTHLTLPTICSV